MFTRRSRSARASVLAFALAGILAGCGGGGGGSTPAPAPTPSGPTLTFAPTTVTGTSQAGLSAALGVTATVNTPSDFANAAAVFAYVIDATGTILPTVQISQPSPTTFHAVLQTAPTLAAGNYKGNFSVRVCRDSACAQHFPGSPMQLPFDITVTPAAVAPMSAVPSALLNTSIYFNAAAKAAIPVTVTAPGRTWTATTAAPWIKLGNASGTGNGSFTIAYDHSALPVATHSAMVVVTSGSGEKLELLNELRVSAPAFTISNGTVVFNAINGAPIPTADVKFGLTDGTVTWSAVSDKAWLTMTPTGGPTPGITALKVNPTVGPLASGSHVASMTVSSPNVADLKVPVTLNLTKATLSLPSETIILGGTHGRDFATPNQLMMYLNTLTNSHQWSLSAMPAWATASAVQGFVNQTGTPLTISPVAANAAYGTTSATVTATALVNGDTLTAPINLTINRDRRKLLFSEVGVAFSSTPNWSRLSRKVTVKDNYGLSSTWTASSDKAWLTVAKVGNELTLTANPATLASDATDFATVTLSSTDGSITTTEPLRVGIWKGSVTPSAITKLTKTYSALKGDPIRPYVYAHNAAGSIDVYNVYTATLDRTIANLGASLGEMAISPSGDHLYTYDVTNRNIIQVDLRTMTKSATWPLTSAVNAFSQLIAIRPNGVDIVLAADGNAYLASSGQVVGRPGIGGAMAATADGSRVFSLTMGMSPASAYSYSMDYADMGGGTVFSANLKYTWDVNASNGQDIAVSADGTRLYTASGWPYRCGSVNPTDLSFIGALPGGDSYPNNIEVGSDGRVFCGISGWYSTQDVWVHSAQGAMLAGYKFAGYARNLIERTMVVSGDSTIIVGLTDDPVLAFIPIGP